MYKEELRGLKTKLPEKHHKQFDELQELYMEYFDKKLINEDEFKQKKANILKKHEERNGQKFPPDILEKLVKIFKK